ncbi:MAG TPA: hypothetical protein VGB85_27405, partial [Nannocystis sp.]|jgi:hypothetical protein
MTPRTARIALAVFATVAALEWIAAARAYRATLTPAVWQRTGETLAALPPDEPVYLGTAWLGPSARQHLPPLRTPASLAPPDLYGVPRFHVLGLAGSPHAGGWSDDLQTDLGELPPPTALGVDELGPLRLHHYAQASTSAPLTDWLAAPSALLLGDDRGPCRLSRETWTCKQGRVAVETLEVAFRARHCLAVALDDGATLEVTHPHAQLGAQLRGHLGFSDFNARLRNDSPALLELFIDETLAARWTISDSQGWAAFAAPTTPGAHAVRLRLTPLLGGTWTEQGYAATPRRTACLELRALAEAAP